jgi:hypothetical protein
MTDWVFKMSQLTFLLMNPLINWERSDNCQQIRPEIFLGDFAFDSNRKAVCKILISCSTVKVSLGAENGF